MSMKIMGRFLPLLVELFSVVEPLTPFYVSYFIRRYLRDWKNRGWILDYGANTRRLGKFHYKIEVDLYLIPKQTSGILDRYFLERLERR